jgi:hypothetical protein
VQLKNPAELAARLDLLLPARLLLVDVPAEVRAVLEAARAGDRETVEIGGDSIRAIKDRFDAALVWREHRGGSRAVFEGVVKRLEPAGPLWVVTALKKVRGPETPAVHRIELADLVKAFARDGFTYDREVRVSAWHVAYRFVRKVGPVTPRRGRTSP